MLQLGQPRPARSIYRQGQVGPPAENLPRQASQHVARPDFDEDPCASTVHGLDLISKPDRLHQVLG